jgi:hypothetical protein
MRRSLPILSAVAVIGAFAGVVIAGQEDGVDTFVIEPEVVDATTVEPTSTAATPVDSTVPAVSVTASTAIDTTTAPTAAPSTSPPSTTTTAASTTTTSTPAETTVPADQTVPKADVRLVVANGDGRFNLASINANRLRDAGYVLIDEEDASKVPATILYYRPGFDDEAAIVAVDLLVPDAILEPLPDTPITDNDALGDIIVILGPDSFR